MKINKLRQHWQKLAEIDPLWAVLSWDDKKNSMWQNNLAAFFKTGEDEIAAVMEHINKLGLDLKTHRALDFGCGVGRLTLPLKKYFSQIVGVDISQDMIKQAQAFNKEHNCDFLLNTTEDLKLFTNNSFSFIYSRLTFQHMEPQYTKKYIQEFVRILEPGGIMVFVKPQRKSFTSIFGKVSLKEKLKIILPVSLQNLLRRLNGTRNNLPTMELYSINKATMTGWLNDLGVKIVNIDEFGFLDHSWECLRYMVIK